MSASGTKRTCRVALHMSAFGGKADMRGLVTMSAYDPKRTLLLCSDKFRILASPFISRLRRIACPGLALSYRFPRYTESAVRSSRALQLNYARD